MAIGGMIRADPTCAQRIGFASMMGDVATAGLAIAADAQFPVDFFVLGRSYRRIFVLPWHVFDPGLAMAPRGPPSPIDLPGVGVCLPRGLRTAAGTWLTRIVLSQGSTANGQGYTNGISRCDYTHGHHPFLLRLGFNVRRSDEFPLLRCVLSRLGHIPSIRGNAALRSLSVEPTAEASTGANAAEPVERRAGAKGNAHQQSTHWTQSQARVSQALERIRQAIAVIHPRWEPYAGKPLVRFCAGGAMKIASLPLQRRGAIANLGS